MIENVTVIPADYNGDRTVTPIYLLDSDRNGNPIDPRLIDGIAQCRVTLCYLAAKYLRDANDASDLAEATVHRLNKKRELLDRDDALSGIIVRTATQIAREWTRPQSTRSLAHARAGEQKLRQAFPDTAPAHPEDDYVEQIQARRLVDAMREEMTEDEQVLFDFYLRGFNWQEIADRAPRKTTPGAVHSFIITRARKVAGNGAWTNGSSPGRGSSRRRSSPSTPTRIASGAQVRAT